LLTGKIRQNVIDCRGPLQTYGSSWGQEQQDAGISLWCIEVILTLIDILGSDSYINPASLSAR
jgi:hypothetical protein